MLTPCTIQQGDSLKILQESPDNCVDLVITSPPYPGVESMWGEDYAPEKFYETHIFLNKIWDECLRVLRPGCKLIINIANTKRSPYLANTHKIYEWAYKNSDKVDPKGEIIWDKGYGSSGTAWGSYCNPSDISLADRHEYILVFRKAGVRDVKEKGKVINPNDFCSWRNSIWSIAPAKASKVGHMAPFPLEIPRRLITLYSYEGELVLDPFIGSGTTAIAAVQLNRKYVGIDHNEEYVELARKKINSVERQKTLF